MRRLMSLVLCLGLGANGIWMLAIPAQWYVAMPGVADTGPANMHFIRDIGAAYLVSAMCLVWLLVRPTLGWPAAFASGMFLFIHALVHIWDAVVGRETLSNFLRDLLTVLLPAILTLWLAWPAYHLRRGSEMVRWFLKEDALHLESQERRAAVVSGLPGIRQTLETA